MELRVTATARDGAGVARADDGRVVFVEGALPGEHVEAEIVRVDKRWSRARVVRVIEASPDRVPVSCCHVSEGCGGCDMLHVADSARQRIKCSIVVDQLTRVGLDAPAPALRTLDDDGGRTTVRAAVHDGRAGYRMRSSHEIVIPEVCDAVDPAAEQLLIDGRFGHAQEVTIRVGARTGERMVVVDPRAESVSVPDDVMVVGTDELAAGRRAWIHEEVAGRRFRISARSFFQNRPAGADALVAEVAEMIDEYAPDGPMVDAFAGVGLFGGTVGVGRPLVAIERGADSVADARVNLADTHPDNSAKVLKLAVQRWRASPAAVVVADPAREGLGKAATRLCAAQPELFVLVSCDPSSFARDARQLCEQGYELRRWTVVEMFPGTTHVETVAAFTPSG